MKNKLIFVLMLLLSISLYGQISGGIIVFQLGNAWIFEPETLGGPPTEFTRKTIKDTNTVINGIKYIQIKSLTNYSGGISDPVTAHYRLRDDGYYVVRLGSFYPEPEHEYKYYKTNPVVGEYWKQKGYSNPDGDIYCIVHSQSQGFINGQLTTLTWILQTDSIMMNWSILYSDKFGVIREVQDISATNMRACVINGIVYGDTTFYPVGVEEEKELRKKNEMEQNYPNPFRNSTDIAFSVKERGEARLDVYNSIGEHVRRIKKEIDSPGKYRVKFLSDGLPAGTYLYRISAGEYTQTKKMLIIR